MSPLVADLLSDARESRDRSQGQRLREAVARVSTPGTTTTPTESSDLSSCHKAKAAYVGDQAGGPAGAVLVLDSDVHEEDRAKRWTASTKPPEQ